MSVWNDGVWLIRPRRTQVQHRPKRRIRLKSTAYSGWNNIPQVFIKIFLMTIWSCDGDRAVKVLFSFSTVPEGFQEGHVHTDVPTILNWKKSVKNRRNMWKTNKNDRNRCYPVTQICWFIMVHLTLSSAAPPLLWGWCGEGELIVQSEAMCSLSNRMLDAFQTGAAGTTSAVEQMQMWTYWRRLPFAASENVFTEWCGWTWFGT